MKTYDVGSRGASALKYVVTIVSTLRISTEGQEANGNNTTTAMRPISKAPAEKSNESKGICKRGIELVCVATKAHAWRHILHGLVRVLKEEIIHHVSWGKKSMGSRVPICQIYRRGQDLPTQRKMSD